MPYKTKPLLVYMSKWFTARRFPHSYNTPPTPGSSFPHTHSRASTGAAFTEPLSEESRRDYETTNRANLEVKKTAENILEKHAL